MPPNALHIVERPKVRCPVCSMWRWLPGGRTPRWLDGPVRVEVSYVTCAGRRGFPHTAHDVAVELATLDYGSGTRKELLEILRQLRRRLEAALSYVNVLIGDRVELGRTESVNLLGRNQCVERSRRAADGHSSTPTQAAHRSASTSAAIATPSTSALSGDGTQPQTTRSSPSTSAASVLGVSESVWLGP